MTQMNGDRNGRGWGAKEKVLTFSGLTLIGFALVGFMLLPDHPFRVEFVLAGLALCGVAIAQWGDKK